MIHAKCYFLICQDSLSSSMPFVFLSFRGSEHLQIKAGSHREDHERLNLRLKQGFKTGENYES